MSVSIAAAEIGSVVGGTAMQACSWGKISAIRVSLEDAAGVVVEVVPVLGLELDRAKYNSVDPETRRTYLSGGRSRCRLMSAAINIFSNWLCGSCS